jgi:penicillin-binding protein 2
MSKVILPGQKKPIPVDTTKKKPVVPVPAKPVTPAKPVATASQNNQRKAL